MASHTLPRPLDGVRIAAGGDPLLRRHVSAHLAALGARVDDRRSHGPVPGASFTADNGLAIRLSWSAGAGADEVGDEATAQAAAGLMHVHGRRSGRPTPLPLDYVAACSASATATGVLAAEFSRRRGAPRDGVDVRADGCALLSVSQYLAAACAPEPEAVPVAAGGATFITADGVDFEIEALSTEPWAVFWRELGAPAEAVRAGWAPFQFRYATACAPLPDALRAAAAGRSWEAVRAAAARAGAGLARVRDPEEYRAEAAASGGWSAPWDLDALAPVPPAAAPAPVGLPLEGIRVLEAGRRIQAPLAAHLLRLLGATVVRVEPPGGDPLRGMPPVCGELSARWLALNRGKDAVEVDIKDSADRGRLLELAAGADVFLHSWAPGRAESLGLGAETFSRANPGLVYAHTSGWGGRLRDAPPGTDFMVQARAGVSARDPATGSRSVASLMTVVDMLGGFVGAQSVLAALLAGSRARRGVRVESSLLGAAHTLSAHPRTPPARLLRAADGWVAVSGAVDSGAGHVPAVEAAARLRARGVAAAAVTTDLTRVPGDPRFAGLLSRDERGCVAVRSPWSLR